MRESPDDTGLIQVLLERLEKQRLPRLMAIKARVDSGDPPTEMDLDFMEQAITEGRKAIPLIDKHPEYQELAVQVMSLYKEITDKAMKLEGGS